MVSSSAATTPGPWKYIEAQAVDPLPLSIGELFPARYSAGANSGIRTVDKVDTKCTKAVIGSTLQSAVGKAGCTQVLRASYLSANRKLMATIGVLNLVDVAAAEKVGKLLADRAKAAGINEVAFDRGHFLYHGRVKALADGARAGGLNF